MSAIIIRKLFCSKRDCDKLLGIYLKLRKLLKISKIKCKNINILYSSTENTVLNTPSSSCWLNTSKESKSFKLQFENPLQIL